MRDIAATLVIVGIVVGGAALSLRPRGAELPSRCDALFDRYVELRRLEVDPESRLSGEASFRFRSSQAVTDAIRVCRENLTEREAECADRASDPGSFERCFP
jgi:hypothetical protein